MFKAKNGNGEKLEPSAPVVRSQSETYARAITHVTDLEQQVHDLTRHAGAWERAASLAEGERDRLAAELADVRHQKDGEIAQVRHVNEVLKALFVRLEDRINRSDDVLRSCREDIAEALGGSRYQPKPKSLAAVATALAVEIESATEREAEIEKMPSVVTRGPAVPVS